MKKTKLMMLDILTKLKFETSLIVRYNSLLQGFCYILTLFANLIYVLITCKPLLMSLVLGKICIFPLTDPDREE